MRLQFTVNSRPHEVDDVWEGESLLFVLRERLGLWGSKNACEQGECGSCSVVLDGDLVCSCLVAAGQAEGSEILTVEGLADGEGLAPSRTLTCGRAPSSAASAPRGWSWPPTTCCAKTPRPPMPRSGRRWRGTCAVAPGTRRSSTPYASPRPGGPALERARSASCAGRARRRGVGTDAPRPDGVLKVTGRFAFSSDLWAEGMIWGSTVRSPHPRALVVSIDPSDALRMPGVRCVLTHEDVPGRKTYGLEVADQPVLAIDEVRYQGEPVAVVAADDPETARRAAAAIKVTYKPLVPVVDPVLALRDRLRPSPSRGQPRPPPQGAARRPVGDRRCRGHRGVRGADAGPGLPGNGIGPGRPRRGRRGRPLHRHPVAARRPGPAGRFSRPAPGKGAPHPVRASAGPSVPVRTCRSRSTCACLALRTGRPVKMVYSREESFFGHVHRHPARLRYAHGADRQGRLVFVRAEMVFDGGAYMSSSRAVVGNGGTLGVGPYDVPNVAVDAWGVYTNNPPCGAMRGFGAVQACFAYESQMDKLAEALGMHPVDVRARNAMAQGTLMPTGQVVDSPAPVAELLRRGADSPTAAAARRAGPPARRAAPSCRGYGQHDARRGSRPGRGVRGGVQERRVLGGLRRLRHRPGDAGLRRRRPHRLGPHGGVRARPRAGHHPGPDRAHRARASNRSWWRRPTPRSAARGRRRRPARPI